MISINKDLFINILVIAIFISSVLKMIAGVVLNGEEKTYDLGDTLDGIIWLIIIVVIFI